MTLFCQAMKQAANEAIWAAKLPKAEIDLICDT